MTGWGLLRSLGRGCEGSWGFKLRSSVLGPLRRAGFA
jgi:hypothetical protein